MKNKVTNLDLNQDGDVDFVRVNEFQEDDVRIFVLSVDISETESQDIAVIELEKTEMNLRSFKSWVMKKFLARLLL